jgi:hypothetical protein
MKTPPKIETHTAALMIGTAIFFDILQWGAAFIFMDWLVSIFAYMTFGLWFLMKGIRILTPKRMSALGGSLLLEVFPFVAALPALTSAVTIVILDAKAKNLAKSIPGGGTVLAKGESEWKTFREQTGQNAGRK